MATVLLTRHGETAWNRDGRMQGWAPVPLNDQGREQAAALGAYLADAYDVDRVVSSDLVRTRETTTALVEALDIEPAFEPDWRERDVGVYQGLDYTVMVERFPEFGLTEAAAYAADRTPDSGESLVTVHERVLDAWDDLLADLGPRETLLVVSHGGPIRLVLGHLKGMTVPTAILEHSLENCCLNEFAVTDEQVAIVRENETPWA